MYVPILPSFFNVVVLRGKFGRRVDFSESSTSKPLKIGENLLHMNVKYYKLPSVVLGDEHLRTIVAF